MANKIEPSKTVETQAVAVSGELTNAEIAQRARAIYEESGCVPGKDVQNWLAAERQLREERKRSHAKPSDNLRVKPATTHRSRVE